MRPAPMARGGRCRPGRSRDPVRAGARLRAASSRAAAAGKLTRARGGAFRIMAEAERARRAGSRP